MHSPQQSCLDAIQDAQKEMGNINIYNIYEDVCHPRPSRYIRALSHTFTSRRGGIYIGLTPHPILSHRFSSLAAHYWAFCHPTLHHTLGYAASVYLQ